MNNFNNIFNELLQHSSSDSKKNDFSSLSENFYENGINLLLDSSLSIIEKETILNKLLFIFPDDYKLYYYMGYIFQDNDKFKSMTWFKLCYEKNKEYVENLLDFTKLLFKNDFYKYIEILNKNDYFNNIKDQRLSILIGNLYMCKGNLLKAKEILLTIINNKDTDELLLCRAMSQIASIYTSDNNLLKTFEYLKIAYELAYKNNYSIDIKKSIITDLIMANDYIYNNRAWDTKSHIAGLDSGRANAMKESNMNSIKPDMGDKHFIIDLRKYGVYDRINEIYKTEHLFNFNNRCKKNLNSRIKIGYISYEFKDYSVSNFILPILDNHNIEKFEIFVFNTNRGAELIDNKQYNIIHIYDLNMIEKCNIIYKNNIDILFDLSGHTGKNELEIFSKNSAPIQISYIGFPNTTGIKSIQYRITDNIADNPESEQIYSEKLIYLPKCFLLYKPILHIKPVITREIDDFIVLGSLNRDSKNSFELLQTWKIILNTHEKSKLLLLFKIKGDANILEKIRFYTIMLNITEDRLIIMSDIDNNGYIDLFGKIDILLDTFPYSGTTTTCNALYNSVPVVTLYNKNIHCHNVSSSLLINSGLPELVAYSEEEYINIVLDLCNNKERITNYKKNIHNMFQKLMNAKEFMNSYEELLINVYKSYT